MARDHPTATGGPIGRTLDALLEFVVDEPDHIVERAGQLRRWAGGTSEPATASDP